MQTNLATSIEPDVENPLLWPIMEVLRKHPSDWKVHVLAAHLGELGYIYPLDDNSARDLFKRNFLIMNALYQLQEILYPEQWLQVEAMDIALLPGRYAMGQAIDVNDPLRDYYLQWNNYDAQEGEVKRLLNEFWSRYRQFIGGQDVGNIDRIKALQLFQLGEDASDKDIRRRWRQLALRWHPDRANGDSRRFRILCEAWNILRH